METRDTSSSKKANTNVAASSATVPHVPRFAGQSIPPPPPPLPPFKFDAARFQGLPTSSVRPDGTRSETTHPFTHRTLPTLDDLPIPPPPLPPLTSSLAIPAVSHLSEPIGITTTHELDLPPLTSAPNSGNLTSCNSSQSISDDDDDETTERENRQDDSKYHSTSLLGVPPPPPPPPPSSLQPKRHMSFSSAPASKLQSPSQSHLPILVLATSTAQSLMMRKNQMSLGQAFTAMANSCITHAPHLLGRIPPFKSIHRPIILKWEDLHFRFYDGFFDPSKDTEPSWNSWEEALSYACHTWEGDHKTPMLDIYHESNLEKRIERDSIISSHTQEDHGADKAFELTAPYHLPWLLRFRSILDTSTTFVHPDLITCPPVCLLVASTNERKEHGSSIPAALECLSELANLHHWPSHFHNGLYDPKAVKREFLLIHDEEDGPQDFIETLALREMQNRFGPGCCGIVRINSLNPCKSVEDPLWDAYVPALYYPKSKLEFKEEMTKLRGLYLDDKDLLSLRRYLIQMITLAVIPSMERRIAHLNLAVTNGKKGVKNALKSLWRKPKDGSITSVPSTMVNQANLPKRGYPAVGESGHRSGSTPNGLIQVPMEEITYRYDSIESQTRLLADSLFLLRDFEAALETYRLVKDDYKQDKSLMHCATVYEMIALCLTFLDLGGNRNKREILQCVDSALYYYSSAAEDERPKSGTGSNRPTIAAVATRRATRLCLVISSHRNICSNNDLEMADMLASSSSNETAVAAATLLEQSASHYYRAGMQRKFGFHMLMAGHMFRSSGQDHHALRCFTSAMYVYTYGKARWDTLSNHVSSALASQLQNMGKMKLCVQLYAKLVSKGGKMTGYVKNLIKCIERLMSETSSVEKVVDLDDPTSFRPFIHGNAIEFQGLDLPIIIDSTVRSLPPDLSHVSSTFERFEEQTKTDDQGLTNEDLGTESIWEDLASSMKAELEITKKDITVGSADTLQMIMAEICRQSKITPSGSRAIKKGTSESRRPCIRMEPILVTLVMKNPLNVSLPISEIQLIARLRCQNTGKMYTNDNTIEMSGNNVDMKSTNLLWTFQTSREIFYIPEFYHACLENGKDSTDLLDKNIVDGPCYVVSKLNMELQPQATVNASLEICPLILGEIDIIGARWRAFDQFWVNHKFQYLREPSFLKFHIERDLPNLVVDFVPKKQLKSKPIILQGQVDDCIMRISNIGTAPANSLFLKSNFPWMRVLSKDEVRRTEDSEQTSNYIGPTGTLMKIPLCKADVIQPGQTIEIPIQVRPSGGGKQDCYLLFRYQLACYQDDETRVRWIRKILSFPVYPSITITASLMPYYRMIGDHILSLDITNYRSDTEGDQSIYLSGVYIASRRYEIKRLIDSSTGTHSENDPLVQTVSEPIKIDWQEQRTLHFLVCPTTSIVERSLLSRCLFSADFNDSCTTDFICIENAHDQFTVAFDNYKTELARIEAQRERDNQQPRHVAHIRRDKSSISEVSLPQSTVEGHSLDLHPDVSSLDSLCPPQDILNVICCWASRIQNDSLQNRGQHHLRGLIVRPQHKSNGCPLNIYANYASTTLHDFGSNPAVLDFTIIIRNRLVQKSVDFEMTLLRQPNIEFIGPESFIWSLGGGEETEIAMKATVFSSGVYNLQSVQVNILYSDGMTKVPYIFPIQWLVEVRDSNK